MSAMMIRPLGQARYSIVLLAIVLFFFGTLYFLWTIDSPLYFQTILFFGVEPFQFPFIDGRNLFAWGDCIHLGIDVLQNNPCDPSGLNRLMAYSPVILDIPLHLGARNGVWACIAMELAFLLTAAALLRPSSFVSFVLALVACISPAVIGGMERANPDLLEVTLIAAGAFLAMRASTYRLVPYAFYFVAGLLKFYPFVLLGLLIRERPRILLAGSIVFAGLLAAFVLRYSTVLPQILSMIATIGTSRHQAGFGAMLLPYRHLPDSAGTVALAVLCGMALVGAFTLANRFRFLISEADWGRPNMQLLAVGATVILGCFFAGVSFIYRATYLLFVIPGLLELIAEAKDRNTRRILQGTLGAVLLFLWQPFFHYYVLGLEAATHIRGEVAAYLLLRDLAWWSVMSVFAAFLISYVQHSPVWQALKNVNAIGKSHRFQRYSKT